MDSLKLAASLTSLTEVYLLCKKGSFIEHACKNKNEEIACIAVSFISRSFSVGMLYDVRRTLKDRGIKNVIFFGASELKTLYFSFLGLDLNVIVRHGTTKSTPKKDLLHRIIYSCVHYHVALSEHLLENVRRIIPASKNAQFIKIMPSFIFQAAAKPEQSDKQVGIEPLEIVHIGRIVSGKGQIDAVKACDFLCSKRIPFRFRMLGGQDDETYNQQLLDKIRISTCSESYELLGFKSDVTPYLVKSDIFLFPSTGEGMPNSFIEALGYGCIAIAYNNTVFPEFARMGFHVHLSKNEDIEDLCNILYKVSGELYFEKNRAQKNMELAKQIFKNERELMEWEQILV